MWVGITYNGYNFFICSFTYSFLKYEILKNTLNRVTITGYFCIIYKYGNPIELTTGVTMNTIISILMYKAIDPLFQALDGETLA